MPDRFQGRRCLVTGASSGLGRAVATALAREGAHVVATARDPDRLESWRGACIEAGSDRDKLACIRADLTVPGDIERLLSDVNARFDGRLDLLVQAAGVGAYGRFLNHDPSVLRKLISLNVVAVADVARAAHPMLCRGQNPTMVVFGSLVGRRGLPGRSEYAASKFAITGLVESLRPEWSYDRIRILLVNPGFTQTPFEDHLLVNTAYLRISRDRSQTAEQVAARTLRAITRGKIEITPASVREKLLLLVNRLSPRIVDAGLARWTCKLYRKHLPPRPENHSSA